MAKTNFSKIIFWVLIVIAISQISFFGNLFATVIPDGYQFIDDFESGLRLDIWDVQNSQHVSVSNGELVTGGINQGCGGQVGSVTYKKLIHTEDIKIPFSYSYKEDGDCDSGTAEQASPYISLGPYQMPITNGENVICPGCNAGTTHENSGIIEVIHYDDLDENKIVVLMNGQERFTGELTGPSPLIIGGSLRTEEVKFKPYFSCKINYSNEVVIRERYVAGSQVNLNTLKYAPIKFCPQDLGTVIISDDGLRNEKGTITESIAQGVTLTVPQGEIYEFYYITKFVEGQTELCAIGEAYDTSIDQCVQVAFQQIPTETLLFCEQTSDCIIPQGCNDASVLCVNNQCDYASATCSADQIINEILVETTRDIIVPQIIIIPESQNSITFNGVIDNNFQTIAGKDFTFTGTKVLRAACPTSDGNYVQGTGCYQVDVSWGPYQFSLKDGESKSLSPQLNVSYVFQGRGAFVGEKGGITYDYEFIDEDPKENIFSITFKDIFDIQINNYLEEYEINSPATLSVTIKNKLFDLINSGYKMKVEKGLRDVFLPTTNVPANFNQGTQNYIVSLPTNELGVYSVELIPYFEMISGKEYIGDEQAKFGYYVESVQPTDGTALSCIETSCAIGTCQPNGVCLVQIDCRTSGCPSGHSCGLDDGICYDIETGEKIITGDAPLTTSTQSTTDVKTDNTLLYILGGIALAFFLFNKKKLGGKKR